MRKKERALLEHYQKHIEYMSPIKTPGAIESVLEMFRIRPANIESVPDLGCGTGALCHYLSAEHGARCLGIDYSSNRIAVASAKSPHPDCMFLCRDIYDFLSSDEAKYDLIALFEVLEHLEHRPWSLIDARAD